MNDSEYWPRWSERSHSTTMLLAMVISILSLCTRGPRLRPRSFALLNLCSCLSPAFVLFHRWPSRPPRCSSSHDDPGTRLFYPLYLTAIISRGRLPDDVTSIEARGSSKLDSVDSAYKPYPFSRFNVTFSSTIGRDTNEGRLDDRRLWERGSVGGGQAMVCDGLRWSRSPLDMYRSSTHYEIYE